MLCFQERYEGETEELEHRLEKLEERRAHLPLDVGWVKGTEEPGEEVTCAEQDQKREASRIMVHVTRLLVYSRAFPILVVPELPKTP